MTSRSPRVTRRPAGTRRLVVVVIVVLVTACQPSISSFRVAGTGTAGFGGDAGPATAATLRAPTGIALAADGSAYIADTGNNRVRRVDPSGHITTVAGDGTAGFGGDGGVAAAAQLRAPAAVVLASDGTVFIADTGNHRIRKITTDGTIATIAGTGTPGFSGDGAATAVQLAAPSALALDGAGVIFVADTGNHRIRKITTDGTIATIAGTGSPGFSGDGAAATGAQLSSPGGVVVSPTGATYLADTGNQRVRRVDVDGTISTVAGTGVAGFWGDGAPATEAQLDRPTGLALDRTGAVIVADTGNDRVRRVATNGVLLISTVIGTGVPGSSPDGSLAASSRVDGPRAVAVDDAGTIYVVDTGSSTVRRLRGRGNISGTVREDVAPVPLRAVAEPRGFRIGATAEPAETVDASYSTVLAREFNSLTPENAMKWYTVQPSDGAWNFAPADTVVAFATAHGMQVRGHNLVWAQDKYTPAWVKSIADPATLQTEMDDEITTTVSRYATAVHRWDVVNEPLATVGTGPSTSVFWRVLGPGWIAHAFQTAHTADPSAELWLNEYGTDWVAGKHQALLALVSDLVNAGVPIHGVGLQMHRSTTNGPNAATLNKWLTDFTSLGLRVAITELDVVTSPTDPDAFTKQAVAYDTIVRSCLAVVGCDEVTTWGVTDASTWLDAQSLWPTPTRPLLFDGAFLPKPAYAAVLAALTPPPAPVAGISVEAYDAGSPTSPVASTATAADGHFSLDLYAGRYLLRFAGGAGHRSEWWDDQSTSGAAPAITVATDTRTVADARLIAVS